MSDKSKFTAGTPLPWRAERHGSDWQICYNKIGNWHAEVFADGDAEQATPDARYIVTACNAFPALVEALEELADAFQGSIEGEGYDPTTGDCPVLDKARAALSAASPSDGKGGAS